MARSCIFPSGKAGVIEPGSVRSIRITEDSLYLAAAYEKGLVVMYDFATGECVRLLKMPTRLRHVCEAVRLFGAASYDKERGISATHVAIAVEDKVVTYDLDTNTELVSFQDNSKCHILKQSMAIWEVEPPSAEVLGGISFIIYISRQELTNTGKEEFSIEVLNRKTDKIVWTSRKEKSASQIEGEGQGNGTLEMYQKNLRRAKLWDGVKKNMTAGCLWTRPSGEVYYVLGTQDYKYGGGRDGTQCGLTFLKLSKRKKTDGSDGITPTVDTELVCKLATGGPKNGLGNDNDIWPFVDVDEARHHLRLHDGLINSVVVSQTGRFIATGSDDQSVVIIDTDGTDWYTQTHHRIGNKSFKNKDNEFDEGHDDIVEGSDAASVHSKGSRDSWGSQDSRDSRASRASKAQSVQSTGSNRTTSSGRTTGSGRSTASGYHDRFESHNDAVSVVRFSHTWDGNVQDMFSGDLDGRVHQYRFDHTELTWTHVAYYEEHWKVWYDGDQQEHTGILNMHVMSGRRSNPRILTVTTEDGMTLVYKIRRPQDKGDGKLTHAKELGKLEFPAVRFSPGTNVGPLNALTIDWNKERQVGYVMAAGENEIVYMYELTWNIAYKVSGLVKQDLDVSIDKHPTLNDNYQKIKPTYSMKMPSTVHTLLIDTNGSYRLLVGMNMSKAGGVGGSAGGTICAMPQLACLLYEYTIPVSFLKAMTGVDSSASDPTQRYTNVASAIQASDPCAVSQTSSEFFCWLARAGSALGLKRTLFNPEFQKVTPCTTVPYNELLEALLAGYHATEDGVVDSTARADTNGEDEDYSLCAKDILDEITSSVANHNDFVLGRAKSKYRHSQCEDGGMLVGILIHDMQGDASRGIGNTFPGLLARFLDKLPLMRTRKVHVVDDSKDEGLKIKDMMVKKHQMLVCGHLEQLEVVWTAKSVAAAKRRRHRWNADDGYCSCNRCSKKENRSITGIQSVPLVTPYIGFAQDAFLRMLVEFEDPKYFGSAIVVAVVQDKWDRYGRSWHVVFVGWHLLQLFAIVLLPVLQNEDWWGQIDAGTRDMFTMVVLAAGCVVGAAYEYLQAVHGVNKYLQQLHGALNWWNILDLVRLGLTAVIVAYYFWEGKGAGSFLEGQTGRVLIAITIYAYWFGLFELMKPVPGLGSAVQIAAAGAYEIKYMLYCLLMLVATTSTAFNQLAAGRPGTDGHLNLFDSMYSTYRMLILVDLDDGSMKEGMGLNQFGTVVFSIFIVFSTFAASVVMVNLIIAKLSDQFTILQKQADNSRREYQADFVVTIGPLRNWWLSLDREEEDRRTERCWLHVLAPANTNLHDGSWKVQQDTVEKISKKLEETERRLQAAEKKQLKKAFAPMATSKGMAQVGKGMEQVGGDVKELSDTLAKVMEQLAQLQERTGGKEDKAGGTRIKKKTLFDPKLGPHHETEEEGVEVAEEVADIRRVSSGAAAKHEAAEAARRAGVKKKAEAAMEAQIKTDRLNVARIAEENRVAQEQEDARAANEAAERERIQTEAAEEARIKEEHEKEAAYVAATSPLGNLLTRATQPDGNQAAAEQPQRPSTPEFGFGDADGSELEI